MRKVKSSHIDSTQYDPSTRILTIKFQSGHVYQYNNVPQSTDTAFALAASKGEYFDKYIRGKYAHKKLK